MLYVPIILLVMSFSLWLGLQYGVGKKECFYNHYITELERLMPKDKYSDLENVVEIIEIPEALSEVPLWARQDCQERCGREWQSIHDVCLHE